MARSVLVTGGNRGIGLAVARAFAAQGDNVAITYRSGEPPAGFLAVKCDVTDASSVDAAIAEIAEKQGAVEVLVANAGITRDTLLMRMTDDDFTAVLDANLTGAFRVIRAASKTMLRSRKGSIVLMSSVVAMTGSAGQANYAASKAGMVGLTRAGAIENAKLNITVNAVAPGWIASASQGPQEARAGLATPAGRSGSPDEIAAVIAFLASPQASYVTGQMIVADGGNSIQEFKGDSEDWY